MRRYIDDAEDDEAFRRLVDEQEQEKAERDEMERQQHLEEQSRPLFPIDDDEPSGEIALRPSSQWERTLFAIADSALAALLIGAAAFLAYGAYKGLSDPMENE